MLISTNEVVRAITGEEDEETLLLIANITGIEFLVDGHRFGRLHAPLDGSGVVDLTDSESLSFRIGEEVVEAAELLR